MTLQGFFDESGTHRGSAVTCVAGVIFDPAGLTDFTKEWAPLVVGLPKAFHTVDAVHEDGAFKGWPSPRREVFLDRLAGLTTYTRDYSVIASMPQADYATYVSGCRNNASIPSIYVLCLASCLEMISNLMTDRPARVYYIFERGDENEAEAADFMRRISSNADLKQRFHIDGYAFEDKRSVIALHSADLVAWEWQRNYKNITGGQDGWTKRMDILLKDKNKMFVRHLGPIQTGMQSMFNTIYKTQGTG